MYIQHDSFINQFIFEPISRYVTKERTNLIIASIALCVLTLGVGYLIYQHFFKDRKVTLLGNAEEGLKEGASKVSGQFVNSLNRAEIAEYKEKLKSECNLLESATESLAGDFVETMKIDIQKIGNKIVGKAQKDIEENIIDKVRCQHIYTTALEELKKVRFTCENNFPHNPKIQRQWIWYQKLKEIITKGAKIGYSEKLTHEFVAELHKNYESINTPFARETIFHFLAKENGPLQFVEIFANCRVKFNIQDRNGYTACMLACAKGHDAMALEIIKQGQGKGHNLDRQTEQLSNTMLIIVAGLGYKNDRAEQGALKIRLIEELLSSGASPTKANLKGFTPLHIACLRRDHKIAAIFLRTNPEVLDSTTVAGLKPIDLLSLSYQEASNMINKLLEFPSELDEAEFTANLLPMQRLLGIS